MPGFALGAEVGAEEGGVGSAFLDAGAGFLGGGLAGEAAFPAGADCRGVGSAGVGGVCRCGFGIDFLRGQADLAEQVVDAFVGFGFHQNTGRRSKFLGGVEEES